MKLVTKRSKRLFAFGCSFTKYFWATWPEIIALDLDIEMYNYGRSGAGNTFIANSVAQADAVHNFNQNDLIMIMWSNVCREDKWKENEWVTPGNIFTQNLFGRKYVKQWADVIGYMIRDLGQIHLTQGFLKNTKCQYHMSQMVDILDQPNQFEIKNMQKDYQLHLSYMYKETLQTLCPSFYNILWQNNMSYSKNINLYNGKFPDPHPTPLEHFMYLDKIFDEHKFKISTFEAVNKAEQALEYVLQNKTKKGTFEMHHMQNDELQALISNTTIKENSDTKII